MPRTIQSAPAKAGEGSKAACEAAGWEFAPIAAIGTRPLVPDRQAVKPHYRYEGSRGVTLTPPTGSGIEPQHFCGAGRAVTWAVEQLGRTATNAAAAPSGMDGFRSMLATAVASGKVCTGDDDAPRRPDAGLVETCRDALGGQEAERELHEPGRDPMSEALPNAMGVRVTAAKALPAMHAMTREGLLQKARAALVGIDTLGVTSQEKIEVFRSLAEDLIHLVSTLIDERGRIIAPLGHDGETRV